MRKFIDPFHSSVAVSNQALINITPVLTEKITDAPSVHPGPSISQGSIHKLAWSKSAIRQVKYNKQVAEWIDYDPEFSNWVRACIMLHADNSRMETRCSIPDHWREDIGEEIIIVSADAIPTRGDAKLLMTVSPGVIHVMV